MATYMRPVQLLINEAFAPKREFIWDTKQQTEFIKSAITNKPIGKFVVSVDGDLLDGQQRITTLKRFVNNEIPSKTLAMAQIPKFGEMNMRLQNKFLGYEVPVFYPRKVVVVRRNPYRKCRDL